MGGHVNTLTSLLELKVVLSVAASGFAQAQIGWSSDKLCGLMASGGSGMGTMRHRASDQSG